MASLPRFLLVAVLVTIGTLAGGPANGAFSGGNGKIAFWSTRDGNAEIYVMNGDGSAQTRLTNDPSFDAYPKWSPDGSKIVFSSSRAGPLNIYTMDADGTNIRRVTTDPTKLEGFAAWTADGQQIVFARGLSPNAGECTPGTRIYVVNADGQGERLLTPPSMIPCLPATAPRDSKVAFTGSVDGGATYQIYTIRLDGGNLRMVSAPGTIFNFRANWSPRGNDLVFLKAATAELVSPLLRDIWTMHDNGARLAQLTATPSRSEDSPAWSPRGDKIVFHACFTVSGAFGCQIFVMNADGTGEVQLTSSGFGVVNGNADWQPLPRDPVEFE